MLEACRAADGIILGPVSHSDYPARAEGGINLSADLRVRLDLYANIRPAKSRLGLPHWGRTPMDLVIVRENTEGFYSDRNMYWGIGEFMPSPDMALSVRKITAQGSSRIARMAFELARERRSKVTAVHKVNVIKVSEALFLREVRKLAEEFPDVAYDEQLIDSMAALLVRDAQRYDVIVTTNMFGDILSDEAAELSGSLGLGGAINASDVHCMAQAQHGSAPDIAGQDKANPVSLILSVAMLLGWLARKHGRRDLARAAGVDRAGGRHARRRRGDAHRRSRRQARHQGLYAGTVRGDQPPGRHGAGMSAGGMEIVLRDNLFTPTKSKITTDRRTSKPEINAGFPRKVKSAKRLQ